MSPNRFLPWWTVVDLQFWNRLIIVYPKWRDAMERNVLWDWKVQEKDVMKYVDGELPCDGPGLPWSKAEHVYGIAHVDGDHWVLYELDLATKYIIVYDSLSKSDIWSKYEHYFTGLAEMLCSICNISDYGMQDRKVWQVGKMKHPPQQCNTSDYGIMCIKFQECLTTSRILDEINPEKCGQYKKMLCCDLLDKYLD